MATGRVVIFERHPRSLSNPQGVRYAFVSLVVPSRVPRSPKFKISPFSIFVAIFSPKNPKNYPFSWRNGPKLGSGGLNLAQNYDFWPFFGIIGWFLNIYVDISVPWHPRIPKPCQFSCFWVKICPFLTKNLIIAPDFRVLCCVPPPSGSARNPCSSKLQKFVFICPNFFSG